MGIAPPTSSANRFLQCVAVADGRPEGHVEAEALGVEQPALFLDPGADILAIGGIRADAGRAGPPCRGSCRRRPASATRDAGRPTHGRRSGCCRGPRRSRGHGSRSMISRTMFRPLRFLCWPADLGRVVEQPDVRHRIGDDRLGPRLHQHRDVTARRRTARGTHRPSRGCACRSRRGGRRWCTRAWRETGGSSAYSARSIGRL